VTVSTSTESPSTDSEVTQLLWSAIVDVYQPVLREVVDVLEHDAGIDSGVYSALAYLDREPDGLRIGELHDRMRVRYSQPGLSRLVQRMEVDGLVRRRTDPADRRRASLALTRAGRTRFHRAQQVYRDALDEHLGRFVDARDARALITALEQVAEARRV
jgi:DNA-binding MarR family transcriptional regulator